MYVDTLGLRLSWQDAQLGFAELRSDSPGVNVRLAQRADPRVEPGILLTFGVRDLDAAGATTLPMVTYPGLAKILPLRDPDGHTLQLSQTLQAPPPAAAGLEPVAFLAGSWVRESGDNREEEHWTAPAGGMMVGMARTVNNGRAVFFESLRIDKSAQAIVYWASPGGRQPTPFTYDVKRSGATTAVFANPENAFPNSITYMLDAGGELHVRVAGTRDGKPSRIDLRWRRGGL